MTASSARLSELEVGAIGNWIVENVDRINVLLLARLNVGVLTLIQGPLQCRLRPRYEGFKSQHGHWPIWIPVLYQRFAAVPCDTSPT
jgi:hypothetical protein